MATSDFLNPLNDNEKVSFNHIDCSARRCYRSVFSQNGKIAINSSGKKDTRAGEDQADANYPSRPQRNKAMNMDEDVPPPTARLNAVRSVNLKEWQQAVPELVQIETLQEEQIWVMDGLSRNLHIPILLEDGDKNVLFEAAFIDLKAAKDTGRVSTLQLHSRNMNIDELRPFGIKLQQTINLDPQKFVEWCDRVGNTSVDAPKYRSGNGNLIDSVKTASFRVLPSYNDQKPWFVALKLAD